MILWICSRKTSYGSRENMMRQLNTWLPARAGQTLDHWFASKLDSRAFFLILFCSCLAALRNLGFLLDKL